MENLTLDDIALILDINMDVGMSNETHMIDDKLLTSTLK